MEENSVLQIDIAGNRYQLDAHLENLIPVDRNLANIPIGNLDVAMEHEWQRTGYYDLINRCLYEAPDHLRVLPENVVGFSIPSHHDLLEAIYTTLVIYAEIVGLEHTGLSMKVLENRSEKGMENLPIDYKRMIVIHGTLYEFDKANEQLALHVYKNIHADIKMLDWEAEHVTGYFHRDSLMLHNYDDYSCMTQYEQDELRYFKIPQDIVNHEKRETLTEQEVQKFNEESLKNQNGFYLVDDALSKRLNGELPEVRFDGVTYVADLANLQIHQLKNTEIKFELTDHDMFHDAHFLYNTGDKTPSIINPNMTVMPADTIVIRLTNLTKIDAVGYAEYLKLYPTAHVTSEPWNEPKLKAEVIPLHATNIPELIRRNQMEKEIHKTKQKETQQPQRKKGRRI